MFVKQVKDVAHQWVNEEAKNVPGFYGAFFSGSINRMPDDVEFPSTSDVDVKIVTEAPNPPELHKLIYQNVILEVDFIPRDYVQSSDVVLGSYPTAIHFTTPNIISDPSGELTKIQEVVSKDYARRKWVHKRCENTRDWLNTSLQWLNESDPLHDQVFAWLYPAIILTHIVLVADLQNPTIRKGFLASRAVLSRYGQLSLYESMLGILGSVQLSREQVEFLLSSFTEVFDITKRFVKTPFFLSSNISDFARPISIDGSRELIESGDHREAMFWIAFMHTRCQRALYNDAPADIQHQLMPSFRVVLEDLGIKSFADLQRRNKQIEELLPRVWEAAEAIIAANPEIVD